VNIDFETSQIERHPDVQFREMGDETYLVHPDGEQLYNLNPMAGALWRLIEQPMTQAEMAEIVHAAFPVMAQTKVAEDVKAMMGELLSLGFARVRP